MTNLITKLAFVGILSLGTLGTIHSFSGKEKVIENEVYTTNEYTNQEQSTSISLDNAKALALEKVNGTIIRTEQDNEDFEIYIQSENYIYEIEIDKINGRIDSIDQEIINEWISMEEAKQIALSQVSGTIIDVDFDDGFEYSIEILKGFAKYEVEIDARNGKVLKIEKDD